MLFTFVVPVLPLWWLAHHFLELLTGAAVLATSLALALYAASHRPGAVLATSASGVPAYDYWMGRELHPRVGAVDLKEFCELYPGMAAWAVLNLAFAHYQLLTTGHVRAPSRLARCACCARARRRSVRGVQVSAHMLFINAGQLLYIADSVFCEAAILTTMDITTEGFGFMLAFGDLAWVPFVFTTQAKYIAERGSALPAAGLAAAAALNAVGYYIFRAANAQKNAFRRDPGAPSVRHLKSLPTARGTRLICSGWWGLARHINYTGDWLMGLSWCLACGFGSAVPYVYAAYFAALLAHRERRDDAMCRQKYGADWDAYCERVPYRLIPRVY